MGGELLQLIKQREGKYLWKEAIKSRQEWGVEKLSLSRTEPCSSPVELSKPTQDQDGSVSTMAHAPLRKLKHRRGPAKEEPAAPRSAIESIYIREMDSHSYTIIFLCCSDKGLGSYFWGAWEKECLTQQNKTLKVSNQYYIICTVSYYPALHMASQLFGIFRT